MTTNTPPAVVYAVTEFPELQAGPGLQAEYGRAYAVTELPRAMDACAPAGVRIACPCGIHCGAIATQRR